MAAMPNAGLLAVAGDEGFVKLFSAATCAFVRSPPECMPECDPNDSEGGMRPIVIQKLTAMAGGDVLVIEGTLPRQNCTHVVLWAR